MSMLVQISDLTDIVGAVPTVIITIKQLKKNTNVNKLRLVECLNIYI